MHMQYPANQLLPRLVVCEEAFAKQAEAFTGSVVKAREFMQEELRRPLWHKILFPFSSGKKYIEEVDSHFLQMTLISGSMRAKVSGMRSLCEEAIATGSVVYVSVDDLSFIDGIERIAKLMKDGHGVLEEAFEEMQEND